MHKGHHILSLQVQFLPSEALVWVPSGPTHPSGSPTAGTGRLCHRVRQWGDADPGPQDLLLWLQYTHTHGLQKSCGGKGTARPLSQEERSPTLALTGLYCFSRPLTSKTVLLYYAKVFLGGYLLQTKERMSLSTSKKDICNVKGEMVKPTMFHTWTV